MVEKLYTVFLCYLDVEGSKIISTNRQRLSSWVINRQWWRWWWWWWWQQEMEVSPKEGWDELQELPHPPTHYLLCCNPDSLESDGWCRNRVNHQNSHDVICDGLLFPRREVGTSCVWVRKHQGWNTFPFDYHWWDKCTFGAYHILVKYLAHVALEST